MRCKFFSSYCGVRSAHYINDQETPSPDRFRVGRDMFFRARKRIMNTRLPLILQENRDDEGSDIGTGLATKAKQKVKKPSLYRVLLLNDDFTPMEFVVLVLERFFSKSREQATQIMLHVHNNGVGECGVYTYEVAETKVT